MYLKGGGVGRGREDGERDMGRGKSYSLTGTKLICLDPVPLWLSSVTVPGR